MKKTLLSITALLLSVYCMAQEPMAFPFQGGSQVMNKFFKDSLVVSQEIISKKATGMVIFKFTADQKGAVQKMVIYYADDVMLARPVIDALKKSSSKWIVPGNEKFHDFILPFMIGFNAPAGNTDEAKQLFYNFFLTRKPILTQDQLPLNLVTLLPPVVINYDVN